MKIRQEVYGYLNVPLIAQRAQTIRKAKLYGIHAVGKPKIAR